MTVLDRPATPLESLGKGFESVLPYLQSQNVIKAQQAEAEKQRQFQTGERLGSQEFQTESTRETRSYEDKKSMTEFLREFQRLGVNKASEMTTKMVEMAQKNGQPDGIEKALAVQNGFIDTLLGVTPENAEATMSKLNLGSAGATSVFTDGAKIAKKQAQILATLGDTRGLNAKGAARVAEETRKVGNGEGLDTDFISDASMFNKETSATQGYEKTIADIAKTKKETGAILTPAQVAAQQDSLNKLRDAQIAHYRAQVVEIYRNKSEGTPLTTTEQLTIAKTAKGVVDEVLGQNVPRRFGVDRTIGWYLNNPKVLNKKPEIKKEIHQTLRTALESDIAAFPYGPEYPQAIRDYTKRKIGIDLWGLARVTTPPEATPILKAQVQGYDYIGEELKRRQAK